MKRMKSGEYQAGLYADSWKLDLIQTTNDVLEYAGNPDGFVEGMEREGYQEPPVWTDSKLRRREAMIKMAHGQKLNHDSHT